MVARYDPGLIRTTRLEGKTQVRLVKLVMCYTRTEAWNTVFHAVLVTFPIMFFVM